MRFSSIMLTYWKNESVVGTNLQILLWYESVIFYCRQNAQDLALENDLLMNQMRQTETDTIDVVTFLKKEDQKKDTKVCSMSLSILFLS